MTKTDQLKRILEFVTRGEEIGKKEYNTSGLIPTISGPLFETWMNEIKIFNDRHLKDHPLHKAIDSTIFHHKGQLSSHKNMMGHLIALSHDTEYFGEIPKEEPMMALAGRKTIEQMLEEDIDRCQAFLENPTDDQLGQQIYIEITARYDSIIKNFGDGLYQYSPDFGFYDPDITGETLKFNLSKLTNKMISYQAVHYPPKVQTTQSAQTVRTMSKKVFIVHGHDNEAIQEMARTLERDGFEAIILREQPDGGLTIIEKIEQYTDVDFAVVLYTQCDKGRAKAIPVEQERYRARQNVVFEHGYLIGKLGRDHVCALVKGDVETPGDISGVVYVPMDEHGAWKMRLARNMQDIGLPVDMNKFCR